MMSPDDWNGRTVDIEFQAEDVNDDAMMHRKFTNISKGATKRQILQFGKAVSLLVEMLHRRSRQAPAHSSS